MSATRAEYGTPVPFLGAKDLVAIVPGDGFCVGHFEKTAQECRTPKKGDAPLNPPKGNQDVLPAISSF